MGGRSDFVPNFSSDDDSQDKLPKIIPPMPEDTPPGVEVYIYFPEEQGSDETRRHDAVAEDIPTRPALNPVEIDPGVADPVVLMPENKFEEPPTLKGSSVPPVPVMEDTAPPPSTPQPKKRSGNLIVGVAGLLALVCGGIAIWLGVSYQNNSLPPQIARMIPGYGVVTDTPTEAAGEATNTARPEATRQSGNATAVPSETPAIGVTALPSGEATDESTSPSVNPVGENQIRQAGMVMNYVPGGTFPMGSTDRGNEDPVHEVTLDPYYIDQYEITNANWAACVEAGICDPPADTASYDGTPYYGDDQFLDYPVVYVSWYNAQEYCEWRGARLPTEAEWEMAARWSPATEQTTVYPWGNEWDASNLNYCDAGCLLNDPRFVDPSYDDGWPQMSAVGVFPDDVSPLGIYDMAGNVAEWVFDWYDPDYYENSPAENPTGPDSGEGRVVRGGGWSLEPLWARATARSYFGALSQVAGIGFRCAASADQVE